MTILINNDNIQTSMSFLRERPFTGEGELVAEDIEPGDVIQFVGGTGDKALILGKDEHRLHYLSINPGYFFGKLDVVHLADRGLKPYEDGWSTSNHTRSLDLRLGGIRPIQLDIARQMLDDRQAMDALRERHGGPVPEPTLEELAALALLNFSANREVVPSIKQLYPAIIEPYLTS